MKEIRILDPTVTIKSVLKEENLTALKALTEALAG